MDDDTSNDDLILFVVLCASHPPRPAHPPRDRNRDFFQLQEDGSFILQEDGSKIYQEMHP